MRSFVTTIRSNFNTMPFYVGSRDLVYPSFILLVYGGWVSYMGVTESWFCLSDYWQMPLTMTFGSVVAGSTPTGGAAIAFPVFTKVLEISSSDARTFGLMIQSIGMTSASLFIWHRRIPVLWDVVIHASIGGILGAVVSILFVYLPDTYPRLLFTTMVSLFAIALVYSRYSNKRATNTHLANFGFVQRIEFILLGFVGGLVADATGSGIDIVVFMALALSYRICEKVSIPTTVICMAFNSIVGFILHATIVRDTSAVWEYWLASVPVVAIGAPLGALLVMRCSRNQIIAFILILIAADFVTTILVVEFTSTILSTLVILACACLSVFALMIYRGNHTITNAT